MGKIKKVPKRKRSARARRLALAAEWLKKKNGKQIIHKYAKYFAVDKPCAIKELQMLGVELTEEYKKKVMNGYNRMLEHRRKRKEAPEESNIDDTIDYTDSDEDFAFIVGYTDGGAPYGITWKEQEEIDICTANNMIQLDTIIYECDDESIYESLWDSDIKPES